MRWTQTLIPTMKEMPADAQIVSHQLLLRAGFIRQLSAGVFDLLPLAVRSMAKIAAIIRLEMDAIGCAEVSLPAMQPRELWTRTGRDLSYGENLFSFKDRHGRQVVLGPTHEEVITELVGAHVNSYKQLPLRLYQIQTKFRDEYRPRFGLLRVREFLMKDAYSFHGDAASLDAAYQDFYRAYERIFTRCGVPFTPVEAEAGPIGGSASHEFMSPCSAGEDTIVTSTLGNYSANLERAETGSRSWTFGGEPTGELEKVYTPDMPGIEDVGKFLKVKPKNMLKTLVFRTNNSGPAIENASNPKWLVAIVRGDHEVNEAKLLRAAREAFHIESITMEDSPAVREKWAIGFCGPDKAVKDLETVVLVDPDAAQGGFWLTGANEIDHHYRHFNWFRECGDQLADPRKVSIADIRNAQAGDPSPKNDGGTLQSAKGIELGHVFKLGTRYSEALDTRFKDGAGALRPIIMGCYGIGLGRILLAAVENANDERGIRWPMSIAPYSAIITPVKYEGEVRTIADRLHDELNAMGIDTLLDDRIEARPGSKFADADLIGIPVRINVGERGLKEGMVEVKQRGEESMETVKVDQVTNSLAQYAGRGRGRGV